MRYRYMPVTLAMALIAASPSPSRSQARPETSASHAPRDPNLPPGEEDAKQALETSPRHGEFVDVSMPDGTPIRTWVVYPERKDKAGVVLVIHEIFGLSDWIRSVADQLARDGFIAVAPDLISGMGPGGGGTDSVASRDDVVKLIRGLSPEEAQARLEAVRAYAVGIPAANGKIASVGFCWGGARSFEFAASPKAPAAVVVYYGTSPDSATLSRVTAPVLGLYGGDDARVDATIPPAREALKKLGRSYETHLFEGAGHGFARGQSLREGANREATRQAWPKTIAFLRKYLK